MIGWCVLCVFAVLVLLAFLIRLGVWIGLQPSGFFLKLRIGPCFVSILPRKKDPDKQRKKREKKEAKKKKKELKKSQKPPKPKKKLNIRGILALASELLPVVQDAARMFFQRLRIDDLILDMTWGGTDPADTAIRYGQCWAALESALSVLENFVTIRKRRIAVKWNYQLEKPAIYGSAAISLSLAQLVFIGVVVGVRGGRAFLAHRKNLFIPQTEPVRPDAGKAALKGDQNHGKESSCE